MPKGKNQQEVSNAEILEVVNFIKDNAVTRKEFQEGFQSLDKRITRIESQMVTKDYLDTKMADLRGDLTITLRKEDTKLKTLVNILEHKKVLSKSDVNKIAGMEPFPQLAL